jgi:hypothetical protein
MAEEVFGFTGNDSQALLRLLGGRTITTTEHDTYDATRLVLAYTSAGATARVGTTLGTGTATLRYIVAGVLTTSSEAYSFYNLSTGAVAAGVYIMLLRVGSDFVCVWEEC